MTIEKRPYLDLGEIGRRVRRKCLICSSAGTDEEVVPGGDRNDVLLAGGLLVLGLGGPERSTEEGRESRYEAIHRAIHGQLSVEVVKEHQKEYQRREEVKRFPN